MPPQLCNSHKKTIWMDREEYRWEEKKSLELCVPPQVGRMNFPTPQVWQPGPACCNFEMRMFNPHESVVSAACGVWQICHLLSWGTLDFVLCVEAKWHDDFQTVIQIFLSSFQCCTAQHCCSLLAAVLYCLLKTSLTCHPSDSSYTGPNLPYK